MHICVHDECGLIAKSFKMDTRVLLLELLVFIKLARLDPWSGSRKLNDDPLLSNYSGDFLHNTGTRTLSCQWLLGQ